jgi:hypothetical protein
MKDFSVYADETRGDHMHVKYCVSCYKKAFGRDEVKECLGTKVPSYRDAQLKEMN